MTNNKHQNPNSRLAGCDAEVAQASAYVHYQKANIPAWWKKIRAADKPPTPEQESFLQHVLNRCQTEQCELNRWNGPVKTRKSDMLSEPVRICLFGDPGAGKSHCLHLLRDCFKSCCGWDDAVRPLPYQPHQWLDRAIRE